MPPIVIIAIPCEHKPCNINETLTRLVNTLNSTETEDSVQDYDGTGAARFIIATVLVYSLMGVFGMLLLRIKRSASKTGRAVTTREESVFKYIKKGDRLMLEARRFVMKREAERTKERLTYLRQQSEESTTSPNPSEFSPFDSLNLSTSYNSSQLRMPQSPTNLSLLMPLLPTVPETSTDHNQHTPGSAIHNVLFHFPGLSHIQIPQTILSSQPTTNITATNYSINPAISSSTPITIVPELTNYFPSHLQHASVTDGNVENSSDSKSSPTNTDCNMNKTSNVDNNDIIEQETNM